MMHPRRAAILLLAPAALTFLVFVAAPLLSIVWLSLHSGDGAASTKNYVEIATDPFFQEIYLRTFGMALATTLASVVLGTAAALVLFRVESRWRSIALLACLAPLLISVVVRTMGWGLLLGPTGVANLALQKAGLLAQPIQFMYTITGVVVALVHITVTYVVISVWAALERLPKSAELAAITLGATKWETLLRVTLPLALPGIVSGTIVVFAVAFGAFATPAIMGGGRLKTAANIAYDEFLGTQNWPLGSAHSVLILAFCAALLIAFNGSMERRYRRRGGA